MVTLMRVIESARSSTPGHGATFATSVHNVKTL